MRKVSTTLAVLSLFLFLLTATFWFRSIRFGDLLGWRRAPDQLDVVSVDGIVNIGWGRIISAYPAPEGWTGSFWPFARKADYITSDDMWKGSWAGFHLVESHRRTPSESFDTTNLSIPYWFPALAFIAFPLRRGITFVQKRPRKGRMLCSNCHYDLRAHAPGDNCPECGTPILSPSAKT